MQNKREQQGSRQRNQKGQIKDMAWKPTATSRPKKGAKQGTSKHTKLKNNRNARRRNRTKQGKGPTMGEKKKHQINNGKQRTRQEKKKEEQEQQHPGQKKRQTTKSMIKKRERQEKNQEQGKDTYLCLHSSPLHSPFMFFWRPFSLAFSFP